MAAQTHCHGCGNSFKSFSMTQAQGVDYNGHTFCNDDCQMESKVDEIEQGAHMAESGLNADGSEW